MNAKSFLFIFLIGTCFMLTNCSQHKAVKSIEVTFVSNAGYLISLGNTKILIDAPCKSTHYINPSDDALRKMMRSEDPFTDINYLLITHPHRDHFKDSLIAAFMTNHKETELISSTGTCDSLEKIGYKKNDRTTYLTLDTGQQISIVLNKTKVTAIRLKHTGNENIMNLAFLVEANGYTFFHTGDGMIDRNEEYLNKINWDSIKVNVLFLEYFDKSPFTLRFINNKIRPKHIVLVHASEENIPNAKQVAKETFMNAIVFDKPMQKIVFTD
jgi:L-ascorbate metabolism protein UlaG (beta-lactamase superfamily)